MTTGDAARVSRRELLAWLGRGMLVTGTLGVVSGCGPGQGPAEGRPKAAESKPTEAKPAAAAPAATSGEVTLLMWTHYAGKNLEIFNTLLGDFKRENPDVTIDVAPFGPGEIDTKFLAAVAGGQPPDIHHPPGRIPPEMALGGALTPLDDFVKFPPDLLKNFDELTVFGGRRYGMPANGGLGAMAYNATLLAEARLGRDKLPSTWEELADAAEKFTGSGPGRWGVIFPNQPVALTTQTTWSFMMQNGAELVSPDGSAPAFNTEATREVFQFATDLVQTWKVSPVKTYGLLDTWNDYGTGNVGAVNLYPAWIGNIKTFGFETVTAPMPKKKQPGTQFAGNYFTLAARSQKREPFARFVEWWARPEVNARWCMETGAIPIRRSVIDLPTYQDYLKREPLVKPFIDSIPFARPWPGVVGITGLLQVLAEAWEASILGKMKPKEAIERAEKRAGDELKRAQAQYRS